jgi:tetrahydromethanopterin S-methyltransferase subunit A
MVKEQKLTKDLLKIENRLKDVLQPISPPAVFVTDLRSRLDQEMVKKTTSKKVKTGLLVAGGIVGIVVMLITLIRSLISLPGVIKSIVEKFPRLKKREQAASI